LAHPEVIRRTYTTTKSPEKNWTNEQKVGKGDGSMKRSDKKPSCRWESCLKNARLRAKGEGNKPYKELRVGTRGIKKENAISDEKVGRSQS